MSTRAEIRSGVAWPQATLLAWVVAASLSVTASSVSALDARIDLAKSEPSVGEWVLDRQRAVAAERMTRSSDFAAGIASTEENTYGSGLPSAFVRYRVAYLNDNLSTPGLFSAGAIQGLRWQRALLYNEIDVPPSGNVGGATRGNTALAIDWHEAALRVTFGDIDGRRQFGAAEPLTLAGVGIRREVGTLPHLGAIAMPEPGGTTAMAGEVSVSPERGTMIRSSVTQQRTPSISSAPVSFAGVSVAENASRTVGLATWSPSELYQPTPPLPRGIAEYEYAVGTARSPAGPAGGATYGGSAFIAMYRAGVTDQVTIGGHAEGVDSFVRVGVDLDIGAGDFGVINGNLGATGSQSSSMSPASAMRYNFSRGALKFTAGYEHKADGTVFDAFTGTGTGYVERVVQTFGGRVDYAISASDSIALVTDRSMTSDDFSSGDALPQTTTRMHYRHSAGPRFGIDGLLGFAAGASAVQGIQEGWSAAVNFRLSLGP